MMSRLPIEKFSIPISHQTVIASGLSSIVHELTAVVKQAKPEPECLEQQRTECAILTRLGHHPRIIDAYYVPPEGEEGEEQDVVVLERLDTSLRAYVQRSYPDVLPDEQILLFAEQLVEGYQYLHSKNVYHVDIGAYNVLIDKSYSQVKLCDFGSSSMDGSKPLGGASIQAQCPWRSDGPSIETELFGVGSLLFELSTGREVYKDTKRSTIKQRFLSKQFPATDHLILGSVITKCWNGQYTDVEEALNEIRSVRDRVTATATHRQRSSASAAVLRQRMQYGSILLSVVGCGVFLWRRWHR